MKLQLHAIYLVACSDALLKDLGLAPSPHLHSYLTHRNLRASIAIEKAVQSQL